MVVKSCVDKSTLQRGYWLQKREYEVEYEAGIKSRRMAYSAYSNLPKDRCTFVTDTGLSTFF